MKHDKKNRKLGIRSLALFMMLNFIMLSFTYVYASEMPDPEIKGSITVHKHSAISESKYSGTGLGLDSAIESSLGYPVENVGLSLYKVKPGYTINHTVTALEAKLNSDFYSEKFTDKTGIVEWTGLEHGYYVLVETYTPSGYEKSADSIITLPMGITENGSGWNYHIHAYPKSIRTESLFKEVINRQAEYKQGESVFWQIQGALIPDLKNGSNYGSFVISDPLDHRLTYIDDSETIYARGGINAPIKLESPEDYWVGVNQNNEVSWKLTNIGIDKIFDEKATWLSVDFETVINENAIDATPNTNTKIYNSATISGSDAKGINSEKSIEGDNMSSISLSGIKILKVDSVNTSILLDGAEFKIAKNLSDAKKGVFMKKADSNEDIVLTTGENSEVDGIGQGVGIFTGLTSSESGKTSYYLVETKAPAGYVLRKSIIEVSIEKDSKSGLAVIENQKIGNPPLNEENPTFPLPKTGGVGFVLLIILGTMLVITSGILLVYVKKNSR